MINFQKEFSQISTFIQGKKRILLATHEHPDGDALGSMTAMYSVLRRYPDKAVVMFSKDPVSKQFQHLPQWQEIVPEIPPHDVFSADLFFAFDYGDYHRLGIGEDEVRDATVVSFDHHPLRKQRGNVMVVDPSCSSTCELLYRFFSSEGYRISHQTATALLTGILTDTGGFAHVNTSVETLRVAENLLRYGTSTFNLYRHTFSSKSPRTLRVWGHILKNISRDQDLGMAYALISHDEYVDLALTLDDLDGIVNIIILPPDVRFSLLLVERDQGVVKGSMRSEPFKKVDVSRIASALGGGGHTYAAGFERRGESLQDVVECVKIVAQEVVGYRL